MRLELYFLGLIIGITGMLWDRKRFFSLEKTRTKMITIYLIGLLTATSSFVSAYVDCNQTGYSYCVEQTETIKGETLTSKIAITLYDERGDRYDKFAGSGFAIRGFYADIYYEGQELYINKNLTSWNEACSNDSGIMICKGEMMRTEGKKITLQLGSLHDEYIGCPLYISKMCNDDVEWCEWAGIGYLSPLNNTCSHIRVTECFYDEDCLQEEYCDKTNNITWKNWTCKERPPTNPEDNNITTTTRENSRGYTNYKPTISGNTFTYTSEDLAPSFWDTIIKIIRGIGGWF